jgi:MFS family permease
VNDGTPPAPPRSALQQALRPQGKLFYGWWIVVASAGVQAVIGMLFNQAQGAYMAVLREDFGWSRGALSGALALSRIESGMLGPVEGWLLDKYGPRRVMVIGLGLMGAALILFSFTSSLGMFYVTYFLVALGATLGGFLSITVALVNWFSRHRAKAMAIAQIGFAASGFIVPITIASMETFGWQATAFGSGILIWVLGLPLAFMIRDRPDKYGETPDGVPFGVGGGLEGGRSRFAVAADGSEDFTTRQALRTGAFWFISLGHASALLIVAAVMAHALIHLTENLGYSLAAAGLVLPALTFWQITGQLSGGFLGDRFDKRIIATICMGMHCLGILALAYAQNVGMVFAFTFLHGWAWGARGPLMQAIRADYFGTGNFGKIMGVSSLIVALGSSAGPLIAGFLADRTGNYEVGFTVLAALAGLGSVFFMLARKPPPPVRATPAAIVPVEAEPDAEAALAGAGASAGSRTLPPAGDQPSAHAGDERG